VNQSQDTALPTNEDSAGRCLRQASQLPAVHQGFSVFLTILKLLLVIRFLWIYAYKLAANYRFPTLNTRENFPLPFLFLSSNVAGNSSDRI
jgi:hypothetical protein